MNNTIEIFINDIKCKAFEGENVLEVAKRSKIDIPALCYHCDFAPHESCRLCMVEIEGDKNLRASCSLKVRPGMKIYTNSPDVQKALRINLELLYPQHAGKCDSCARKFSCKLTKLFKQYQISDLKYPDRKIEKHKYQFGPSITFDPQKCINCENCSEMCSKQTNGGFIRPREGKYNFEVCPSKDKSHDCIYCGQCIVHCPVGALSEVEDYHKVKTLLDEGKKKVVFQFAPAIRTTLGEDFGMTPGTIVTDQIIAALKKIGAYRVFDTSFAADVTVIEEAEELLERMPEKKGVMFTSCCPAWVKYIEFYEPNFIGNLTSVRSPQIIMGGLIKKYWTKKEKINPKDVVVVSIMPCTAKKFEVTRPELNINGQKPVDIVITTREFAKLLKEFYIDLKTIVVTEEDKKLLVNPTGAGEIFGVSGGVLEAALRTAYCKITGNNLVDPEFEEIHQYKGIKEIETTIKGVKLRAAAVSGIENAKKILEDLKYNPWKYDYVEVMACPGGCIAGGGNPIPVSDAIRRKRAEGLYKSDRSKEVRLAHKSKDVISLYEEFLTSQKRRKQICKTRFIKKTKHKIKSIK